jgi:hypothetical protein
MKRTLQKKLTLEDLKAHLGASADLYDVGEAEGGFLVKPKSYQALLQLYPKLVSLGGEYILGTMTFFIPHEAKAAENLQAAKLPNLQEQLSAFQQYSSLQKPSVQPIVEKKRGWRDYLLAGAVAALGVLLGWLATYLGNLLSTLFH